MEEDEMDITHGWGVEVKMVNPSEGFSIVIETLKRIGVATKKDGKNVLIQSTHILQKRGRFFIMHFKEMFGLDGRDTTISDEDISRRNLIIKYLVEWGLVVVIDEYYDPEDVCPPRMVKVLTHKESKDWILDHKYKIGGKTKRAE